MPSLKEMDMKRSRSKSEKKASKRIDFDVTTHPTSTRHAKRKKGDQKKKKVRRENRFKREEEDLEFYEFESYKK
jgi:hypothetical protein